MNRELIISGTRFIYEQDRGAFVEREQPANVLMIREMKDDGHLLSFEYDPLRQNIYDPKNNSQQLAQWIFIPKALLAEQEWENNSVVDRINNMMFHDQWDCRAVDGPMRRRLDGKYPYTYWGDDKLILHMTRLVFITGAEHGKLPLTLPYIGVTEKMELTFIYDPDKRKMAFPGPDLLRKAPNAMHVTMGHPMRMDPVAWSEIFLKKPEGLLNHYLVQPELKSEIHQVNERIRLQMLAEMRNRPNSPLKHMIEAVRAQTQKQQRKGIPFSGK